MSEKTPKEPSFHDWLALGELDVALAPEKRREDDDARRKNEIRRLPLLLRMLSASQPQSSIPNITQESPETIQAVDPLVDDVVGRLEDVAATYSAAEGVDALTSYHAPTLCRKISRVAPLKRGKRRRQWKTQDLATVAAGGAPSRKKRRQSSADEGLSPATSKDRESDKDNDDEDGMSIDEDEGDAIQSGVRSADAAVDTTAVSADSQEAMTRKCLNEIASLVVASLKPVTRHKDDEEGVSNRLSLSVATDSLLLEPASSVPGGAGAMSGADLGATVSGLMHHAPVLRHQHLAAALCRTGAPQAVVLIERMGANCPSSVPCLLRGCIKAFVSAHEDPTDHASIVVTCKAGVRALASLSSRESFRVRTTLQQSNVMVDVQLELALEQDPIAVACLLNEHFSRFEWTGKDEPNKAGQSRGASTQFPSDALSDGYTSYRSTGSQGDPAGRLSPSMPSMVSPQILRRAITSILDALQVSRESEVSLGRMSLLLRSLSFLALFGGAWGTNNTWTSEMIQTVAVKLVSLRKEVFVRKDQGNGSTAPKSDKDQCFRLFVCACLTLYARSTFVGHENEELTKTLQKCLESAFDRATVSLCCEVFLSRLAGMLKAQDGDTVCGFILEELGGETASVRNVAKGDFFSTTCRLASSLVDLDSQLARGCTDAAAMEDPSALLQFAELDECQNRVEEFVRSILNDPMRCSKIIRSELICDLMQAAVASVAKHGGTSIPQVLPVQLQSTALKINWREVGQRTSQPSLESQFLLQLYYALCFLELEPASPFAVDPRQCPLKEVLDLSSSSVDQSSGMAHMHRGLKDLIEKTTPDVFSQIDLPLTRNAFSCSSNERSVQSVRRALCNELSESIRACKRDQNQDPSGCMAEHLFVYASRQLVTSEAQVTAIRALLAFPDAPLPFITYDGLCQDPLVVLKAPLSVWRCRGLRRIALFVLSLLLEANQNVILKASKTEKAASELLAARDAVIIRCLIMASIGFVGGKQVLSPFNCSMTIDMIREMVAKRPGLVTLLFKQGRDHTFITDFMVDYVPESIHDAESLTAVLAERSSLTSAEKLVTADAALRIAIAHGHRDESAAKTLSYAAFTQLVSSFFLVIGPTGVPVSALGDDERSSGMGDVTQVCRMATFRMLSALQNVRGHREGIRNECIMALQKLAGLCKGESILSGVSGPVVALRKKLLKDIWEAVVRAANSMGAGVTL